MFEYTVYAVGSAIKTFNNKSSQMLGWWDCFPCFFHPLICLLPSTFEFSFLSSVAMVTPKDKTQAGESHKHLERRKLASIFHQGNTVYHTNKAAPFSFFPIHFPPTQWQPRPFVKLRRWLSGTFVFINLQISLSMFQKMLELEMVGFASPFPINPFLRNRN